MTVRLVHLGPEARSLEVPVLQSGLGASLARGLDGNSRIPAMASPTLFTFTPNRHESTKSKGYFIGSVY